MMTGASSRRSVAKMGICICVLRLGVARIRFLLTMQNFGKNPNSAISYVRQMQLICVGEFYLERTLPYIHPIYNLGPMTTSLQ